VLLAGAALLAVKIVVMVREDVPTTSAPSPSAAPRPALARAFAGTRPGLVGLPGVALGMDLAALEAANAAFAKGGVTTPEGVVCVPEIDRDSGRLEAVNMLLGVDLPTAERTLVDAWGEPARGSDAPGKPALFWLDEAAGLRASLRATLAGTNLEVRRMISAAALLGARGAGVAFGFEKTPLLGATPDALRGSYVVVPRASDASAGADVVLVLPVTEFGWRDTRVYVYLADGKVARFTFELEYGRAPSGHREELLALIDARLGEAEVIDAGALGTYRVARGERLVITRDERAFGAWHLSVEAGTASHAADRGRAHGDAK
jgi:hypothetical protein